MAILKSAVVVIGWVLMLNGLEELGHGIYASTDEVVHLLEHVTISGDEKDGRECVLRVVGGRSLIEEVSARKGAHDPNYVIASLVRGKMLCSFSMNLLL